MTKPNDIQNPLLTFSKSALDEMDKQAAAFFDEAAARFAESMKLAKALREQASAIARAQLEAAERLGKAAAASMPGASS